MDWEERLTTVPEASANFICFVKKLEAILVRSCESVGPSSQRDTTKPKAWDLGSVFTKLTEVVIRHGSSRNFECSMSGFVCAA